LNVLIVKNHGLILGRENLNIYDTKQINCLQCGIWVGEVTYDTKIIRVKCGNCASPLHKRDDIQYSSNKIGNIKNKITVTV